MTADISTAAGSDRTNSIPFAGSWRPWTASRTSVTRCALVAHLPPKLPLADVTRYGWGWCEVTKQSCRSCDMKMLVLVTPFAVGT